MCGRVGVLGDVHAAGTVEPGLRAAVRDGRGAGVVAVGPGVSAELIVLDMPAKKDDARRWLLENLSRSGVRERRGREESGTGEGEEEEA